jgi:hypothetical protein
VKEVVTCEKGREREGDTKRERVREREVERGEVQVQFKIQFCLYSSRTVRTRSTYLSTMSPYFRLLDTLSLSAKDRARARDPTGREGEREGDIERLGERERERGRESERGGEVKEKDSKAEGGKENQGKEGCKKGKRKDRLMNGGCVCIKEKGQGEDGRGGE